MALISPRVIFRWLTRSPKPAAWMGRLRFAGDPSGLLPLGKIAKQSGERCVGG